MIEAYAENGRRYMEKERYDHFLFTYHGLPERQLKKADKECLVGGECCAVFSDRNRLCYRAQCFETSRKLAKALGISDKDYTVSFQSRLGRDPWIKPYTDGVIEKLAEKGYKKVLAFSPSFVADCLETTVEIGETYAELFHEKGGEKLQLVESLNTSPTWVKALKEIVLEYGR
jgi:ferrochelatase